MDDTQAGARFPTTKWREGYEITAVDAFISRAERAVSMRDGSVTAREVEEVRFDPVRLRAGYLMDAVDDHLTRLAQDLRALEAAGG